MRDKDVLTPAELAKEKEMPRGGVIPYYIQDGEIRMLFMVPSDPKYGGPAWQIAKGKIDPEDASVEEGAFREAQEELGLFLPNVIERHDLGVFGKIHMFLAHIKDPNLFGAHDDETGAVRWMNPSEFQAEGRDWQRPIVKAAVRLISRKDNV
jgi:8-oxo-dGTP pyrophosphatase MutT (NUDIX family)